jgi:type IV secretory pathway TrbL component
MKEQFDLSIAHSVLSSLAEILLRFVLFFPGFSPLTLASVGFLVFGFWNNWQLLRGVYLITWVSMVVPLLYLCLATYWYGFADQHNSQINPDPELTALLVLFLVIWVFLLFKLRQPIDRKLLSLFVFQAYITFAANCTAYWAVVPFKPGPPLDVPHSNDAHQ